MDKKLIILGVGHVFDLEDKIRRIILEEEPDAIAIELDKERAMFIEKKENKKRFSFSFYYLLAKYQDNVAKKLGVELGKEMIVAMDIAKNKNIPIFYIDKKANEIVSRLWNELSFKEKILFLFGIFFSLFENRRRIEEQLNEIKDRPNEFINEMGIRFPKIKKILIDERDEHMANFMINLMEKYDKVIAIVGEGHVEGIKKIISNKKLNFEIIHLKNLL
ncbi:MAG: TraB/GumN family protein [Thermoplasmatales archaeon]|nr:TraB/GumN family protein [Thermoplasmatales archaeon]